MNRSMDVRARVVDRRRSVLVAAAALGIAAAVLPSPGHRAVLGGQEIAPAASPCAVGVADPAAASPVPVAAPPPGAGPGTPVARSGLSVTVR